ncbi:hypothetical protein N9154_03905 [Akkermansiaceae bacterium]|nr:hypothetical protein [Akkermansiaceae bacterium]
MKRSPKEIDREREEAWVGDAVLALFVREWLLREKGKIDGEAFIRFTANDFLRIVGNPTAVEAEIGQVYAKDGLQAGFDHIESLLLPLFIQREKVRARQRARR